MIVHSPRFSPLSSGSIFAVGLASLVWLYLSLLSPELTASPQLSFAQVHAEEVSRYEHEYIEIIGGCDFAYRGDCVRSRRGPSEEYAASTALRTGVVLKVESVILDDVRTWYKTVFDEPLRYPERVNRNQYVAASPNVRHFYADGVRELGRSKASTTKHILVDRLEQKLYAYGGDDLFMEASISTGVQLTPTPRGIFTIYKKTPTRYMQGPLPGISEKYYDLPGVPWNLYFTNEGGVIHGAYWHSSFGKRWSNGCVNLPQGEARRLYEWAEIGTSVLVRD